MPSKLAQNHSLILKSEEKLQNTSAEISSFLRSASKLRFWKIHFANHDFTFEPKKFNWDYWQKIPFITHKELAIIGLEPRLRDARAILEKHTGRFVLRIPFRKTDNQHLLYLDSIPKKPQGHEENLRKIQITESFALNLQGVLSSLQKSHYYTLVLTPYELDSRMKSAIQDYHLNGLSLDPQDSKRIIDFFDQEIKKRVKKIRLFRSFEYPQHLHQIRLAFPGTRILPQHQLIGFSYSVRNCLFAQRDFGKNSVHPSKYALLELINLDSNGRGEIVVTRTKPLELALIRYRTGIFGKAQFIKQCQCKSNVVLTFEPIKKYQLPLAQYKSNI